MCRGRIFEWKGPVDNRFDDALFEERPDFPTERRGNLPFFSGAARTKRRPGNRETTTKDAPEVDGGRVATHEANDDQTAVDGKRGEIAGNVVAADDIENQIDTLAAGQLLDDVDEIVRAIVDCALGAELFAGAALLVGARGRKHPRAACDRELDRGRADAARSAVEQCRFAGAEPSAVEDIRPDGEERFGNRGSRNEVHPSRNWQALDRRSRAERRVAAARHQRANPIADVPLADAAAEHVDHSGNLEARQIAGAGRRRVRTPTLQNVRTVDARSRYTDAYFSRARSGIRPFDRSEHLRRSGFGNFNRAHLCSRADLKVRLYSSVLRSMKTPRRGGSSDPPIVGRSATTAAEVTRSTAQTRPTDPARAIRRTRRPRPFRGCS